MGNLLRIIQREEEAPQMMTDRIFGNPMMNDMQQTLECIKMLKKETQPICISHKRVVDQICLFERCKERDRFMCSMCQIRSHQNHEEHFVSIGDFKSDLLSYINERRSERTNQINTLKKPTTTIYPSTTTTTNTNSSNFSSNQNAQATSPNSQQLMTNRATVISSNSSSPNSNFLYDSLLKQFQKTEKLSEQFILEGIVNDIDSLINRIKQLNSQNTYCKKASMEILEFQETFSNIIKNFIQRKNLSEAKMFWSQHDMINEIYCGINNNSQIVEMNGSSNSLQQQLQQSQRMFPHRQVLSKKNARGIQTSSSYTTEQLQNQYYQTKKKQKQHQPFMSLIKFFDKFEHRINSKLSKQIFSQLCPIIYLNSNYCLIPFCQGISNISISLYNLKSQEVVKIQRVSLQPNNYYYHIGNDIFHINGYVNNYVNQIIPMIYIESPSIQYQQEIFQYPTIQSQNYIEISDDEDDVDYEDIQTNQNNINSQQELNHLNQEEEIQIQQTPYNFSEDEEQLNSNKSGNPELTQRFSNEDNLFLQDEILEKRKKVDENQKCFNYFVQDEIGYLNQSNQNKIDEAITIQSISSKNDCDLNENKLATFSPIREDLKHQDEYDSELDYLQNIFSSQKKLQDPQNKKSKKQNIKQQNQLHREIEQFQDPLPQNDNQNNPNLIKQNNKMKEQQTISQEQTLLKMIDEEEEIILKPDLSKDNRTEKQQEKLCSNQKENKNQEQLKNVNTISQNCLIEEDNSNSLQQLLNNRSKYTGIQNDVTQKQKQSLPNIREMGLVVEEEEQEKDEHLDQEDESEVEEAKTFEQQNNGQSNYYDNLNQINIQTFPQEIIDNNSLFNQIISDQDEEDNYLYYPSPQINTSVSTYQQYEQPDELLQLEEEQIEINRVPSFFLYHHTLEFFETSLDYLNIKSHGALLSKVRDDRVISFDKTNIIFQKVNFQSSSSNPNILTKEKVIKTKHTIKSVFSISPQIICVCERKSSLSFIFSLSDSVTFYNVRTKKIIKKISNVGFCSENIRTLRIGKGNQTICFKNDYGYFIILNWQTGKEIKKFKLKEGVTFENMRIFIEFYYQMYQDLDFDADKIGLQISDKTLQNTNFFENSLQYCIPYYSQTKTNSFQLGICYLQNKILKSIPFNIKNIQLSHGISQMFISNDQLVILLKNGEIHHCQVNTLALQQKGMKLSTNTSKP